VRLKVVPELAAHPLPKLLDAGVRVTVNSDDPAYFGGYVADNYLALAEASGLSEDEVKLLAQLSLDASFDEA
jgi:adenosine deaminase